ncbi:hypothetical protein LPTSP4_36290 [Leptospira ryugenii]|uniref:Uncharacterized protein n=1 Tax=Leptospira ryugenii TaxID=1917863 RepID=A0A2P2E5D0_9LEPT|nr:hypothetical protein [Leptospira ryugenii]GBF52091.1 hypothetical protein LPTSP4_36290 [Leptospira ryugenii]
MLSIQNIVQFGKAYGFANYEKFRLHYLVASTRTPDGQDGYLAYGLELGLTAFGKDPDSARNDLRAIAREFLSKEERTHEEVFYLLSNTIGEKYWALYRQVCFLFGDPDFEKNKNLTSENKRLKEDIADLHEDYTIQKIEKNQLLEEFEKMKKEFEDLKDGNLTHGKF